MPGGEGIPRMVGTTRGETSVKPAHIDAFADSVAYYQSQGLRTAGLIGNGSGASSIGACPMCDRTR